MSETPDSECSLKHYHDLRVRVSHHLGSDSNTPWSINYLPTIYSGRLSSMCAARRVASRSRDFVESVDVGIVVPLRLLTLKAQSLTRQCALRSSGPPSPSSVIYLGLDIWYQTTTSWFIPSLPSPSQQYDHDHPQPSTFASVD